ncbi:MAG: CHAD domain-containing protein [Pseudomonadota bacterium]
MLKLDDLVFPAPEVCQTILAERLKDVLAQGQALSLSPQAEEALHDLRVAVRRARVWIKQCGACVELPRKARRGLSAFARESSPVRDLEVQEVWLAGVHARAEQKPGWQALRERLAEEHAERRSALLETLPEALDGAQRALDQMRIAKGADDEPFGGWMSEHWMDGVEAYLAAVHHLPEGLHPLRLVGKRLRYMLEPLSEALGAADTLRQLRQGQDAMGRMNDLAVLSSALPAHAAVLLARQHEESIRFALEMGVAPRWATPSTWAGLRAVSQALIDEESEALAALHGWRLSTADALAEGLPRIGVQLAGSAMFDGFGNPV